VDSASLRSKRILLARSKKTNVNREFAGVLRSSLYDLTSSTSAIKIVLTHQDGMGSHSSMRAPSVYALGYTQVDLVSNIRGGSAMPPLPPDKIYQCLTVQAFLLTHGERRKNHLRVRACVRVCARTKLHASRIRAKRRRGRS